MKQDIQTLIGGQELIVVLGGALRKMPGGKWRTTTYFEGDNFGLSGDRLRVIAANYLYQDNQKRLFMVSGGKGQYTGISGVPPVSEVLKEELIRFHIPPEQIFVEKKSGNTLEQLLALQNMVKKDEVIGSIIILSNNHHLPRIRAFINNYPGLTKLNRLLKIGRLKLSGAERILLKVDPARWKKVIDKAYTSSAMKKRKAIENRGIRQIKSGTYNFRIHDEIS
jgi:hypothetical protein